MAPLRIRGLGKERSTGVGGEFGLELGGGLVGVGHLEADGRSHQQARLNLDEIVRLRLSSLHIDLEPPP